MKNIYSFILPELKNLLKKDTRQLFLKDSGIVNYLTVIEPSQTNELEFGEFPAIEALGFAVSEMRESNRKGLMTAADVKALRAKFSRPF